MNDKFDAYGEISEVRALLEQGIDRIPASPENQKIRRDAFHALTHLEYAMDLFDAQGGDYADLSQLSAARLASLKTALSTEGDWAETDWSALVKEVNSISATAFDVPVPPQTALQTLLAFAESTKERVDAEQAVEGQPLLQPLVERLSKSIQALSKLQTDKKDLLEANSDDLETIFENISVSYLTSLSSVLNTSGLKWEEALGLGLESIEAATQCALDYVQLVEVEGAEARATEAYVEKSPYQALLAAMPNMLHQVSHEWTANHEASNSSHFSMMVHDDGHSSMDYHEDEREVLCQHLEKAVLNIQTAFNGLEDLSGETKKQFKQLSEQLSSGSMNFESMRFSELVEFANYIDNNFPAEIITAMNAIANTASYRKILPSTDGQRTTYSHAVITYTEKGAHEQRQCAPLALEAGHEGHTVLSYSTLAHPKGGHFAEHQQWLTGYSDMVKTANPKHLRAKLLDDVQLAGRKYVSAGDKSLDTTNPFTLVGQMASFYQPPYSDQAQDVTAEQVLSGWGALASDLAARVAPYTQEVGHKLSQGAATYTPYHHGDPGGAPSPVRDAPDSPDPSTAPPSPRCR